ncbi:hypothetical protein Hbl1158_14370 [Halobaculum sp. CBA1158]|uniref:HalOD1 output domain-containing protein n=1 Tax=Halobaculum sp. CBA1158 TaxID=2904243 RepID=UPI001F4736B4|nr:HalOD1 output domain-containing protein [Halobaculum sp. CBA1158]UIO99690.1 hypothetical protein Hbl1158_14370 [Halobaculum sp. CBA1158]
MSETAWAGSEDPCVAIVEAVSDATGRSTTELPPLHRSVDIDALGPFVAETGSSCLRVEFDYAGVRVSVDRNGVLATALDRSR